MRGDGSASSRAGRQETASQRERRCATQQARNKRRRKASDKDSDPDLEDEDQRQRRLSRQREYDRHRASTRPGSDRQPSAGELLPVARERKELIEVELVEALGPVGLDETTCAVCDRLVLRRECVVVSEDDSTMVKHMQTVLRFPDDELPDDLARQYNCSDLHPCLSGIMLSRRGIQDGGRDQVSLNVCRECHTDLSRRGSQPPKFAIANGFFVGCLPQHLCEANWIETVMVQLTTVVAQTRVMRGGRHRSIRSHCMVFDAALGPPATLLPNRVEKSGTYKVVLAGPMTDQQMEQIRKLHRVRGKLVMELLQFLKLNNQFYRDVRVDTDGFALSDEDLFSAILIREEDERFASGVDEDQEPVHGRNDDVHVHTEEDEQQVIERNVYLAPQDVSPDATAMQRVFDCNSGEAAEEPRLRLEHSSRFASGPDLEAKMHAHLFPFGRGHPGEQRKAHVSKRDCMRHYALLSSRRFAQDANFMLTAFARLSMENMYTLTSVKCKHYPSLFNGYETITREDLAAALTNNERKQRGQAAVELPNPVADQFLKSVEIGSVSVWGSSAERRQCRQEAFGYQTRYGQPSLFVTLTPNSDNSYAMAHYTGNLSVDTLFDAFEASVPTPTQVKQAAMSDDCASARLFMRTVDAFIAHVLGVDPNTKQSRDGGGLFGKTKAYFGMVETQGRGTLHIHFLIWIHNAPVNSEDYESRLQQRAGEFPSEVVAYVDSVVSTSLPFSLSDVPCSSCGCTGPLAALPIPSSSRKRATHKVERVEPLLVACTSCGLKSSSQQMVRQLIQHSRPTHWLPPLRPLTREEIQARITSEAVCRRSRAHAQAVILNREIAIAALERSDIDDYASALLQAVNATQNSQTHCESDPFRCDYMSRLIEMMPPMSDVARMTQAHQDYELLTLIVNLNMHWWAHTGSCFKPSRATAKPSLCRYGFPRERVLKTTITGTKIDIKRDVGHEFVNGYNAVLMRTFKCNHDVQVLFGGKDATNRIYYCCKYVTKPQRVIDCTSAVALASFQRRQNREIVDAEGSAPPSVEDIQRKRVNGMTYTFTNKQEVAGPLAAHYVLRGSCMYSSDPTAKLPLNDILKQLEQSGEYTCTLVESNPDASSSQDQVTYRSSSFLDDYVNRPEASEDLSMYEFTMKCYRRRRNQTTSPDREFNHRHPLYQSHCVAYRRREAVPVIKGPRLPKLKADSSPEDRVKHAKIALALFKPFRSLEDLVGAVTPTMSVWIEAYEEWQVTRNVFSRTIMQNMYDYFVGHEADEVAAGEEQPHGNNDVDGTEAEAADDDGYVSEDLHEISEEENHGEDMFASLHRQAQEIPGQLPDFPISSTYHPRIQDVVGRFERHNLVDEISRDVALGNSSQLSRDLPESQAPPLNKSELKRWVLDPATDCEDEDLRETAALPVVDRPTSIAELVDEALGSIRMQWSPMSLTPQRIDQLPIYSGVDTVSRAFTLNKLQHAAFALVAKHLLLRWKGYGDPETPSVIVSDQVLQEQQLLSYLGGEGGTGKSRVIGALQLLCKSWQRPKSLVMAAMTGKAASVIGGRTLASFEMTLRSASGASSVRDVDCLIIDEISMMSKAQLLRLDRALRKAKRVPGVPFGGIHVVLVGDFFQLPPVRAEPIYIDPGPKTSASLSDFEGFELWRRFDRVIILEETMRFRTDPEWGEGCSRARYGEWDPAFVEIINQKVLDNEVRSRNERVTSPPSGTVFATTDNTARAAINDIFIANTAKWLQPVLPIRIVANFKGALNNLSRADIATIMELPDSKFGRMAPYLDVICGMPIQITQNIRTKKGVANGTMGYLHSIKFPVGTTFSKVRDPRNLSTVLMPSQRPLYALVRVDRGENAKPISDRLDSTLFPVFPEHEAYSKATIDLTPNSRGEPRQVTLKIQQFPFVCAIGATVYKIQGESLQSMVVVDWKAAGRGANKPQQAYLMVSRVVNRQGFACLQPFTNALAAWSKPPQHTLQEDIRLRALCDNTLGQLGFSRE